MIPFLKDLGQESIPYYGDRLLWQVASKNAKFLNSREVKKLSVSEIAFLFVLQERFVNEIKRRFLGSQLLRSEIKMLRSLEALPDFKTIAEDMSLEDEDRKKFSYSKLPERSLEEKFVIEVVNYLPYQKITNPVKSLSMEYFK